MQKRDLYDAEEKRKRGVPEFLYDFPHLRKLELLCLRLKEHAREMSVEHISEEAMKGILLFTEGDTKLSLDKLLNAKPIALVNFESHFKKCMKENLEWWFELQDEIAETRAHLMGLDLRVVEMENYRREEEYEKTIKTKYYASGKVYFGQMCADELKVPHGYGTMYFKVNQFPADLEECREYEGMWEGGQFHGKGKFFWHNGDSWTGIFWKDRLHGRGTFEKSLYDENGDKKTKDMIMKQRPPSVRFYWNSRAVCYLDELLPGTTILIARRKEAIIVSYSETTKLHTIRYNEINHIQPYHFDDGLNGRQPGCKPADMQAIDLSIHQFEVTNDLSSLILNQDMAFVEVS